MSLKEKKSFYHTIGGEFIVTPNPEWLTQREVYFDELFQKQQDALAVRSKPVITVTLPNGGMMKGLAFETTPYEIAQRISQGLADSVMIAKVTYSSRHDVGDDITVCDEDDIQVEATTPSSPELWDLTRPLVGDCTLQLIKFDDSEGKKVFWHSSAHVLGCALENTYGCHLAIGPSLQQGFYYDCYMGTHSVTDADFDKIDKAAQDVIKKKYAFQRLVATKEEALELFKLNPFKVSLIHSKIPDGGKTTVYKCGPLVDLCIGPHLPNTGKIKAFGIWKSSGTNWLGQVKNDSLQRVYGISFPDKAQLKLWQEHQEQAKQRDHRRIGQNQELIFFHQLSPGSCFWLPHGARIYNRLISFIRDQYWTRGYDEVITPNIYNMELWNISGHAQHYKENMFTFDIEGQEFGMKPMNCPGHCLIFGHRQRSYRELPIRMADFGVLHRNELSGALSGLTRVRRFQQDDAHIFCRQDQIKQEVTGALDFMRYVYDKFGMTYQLELSTKPEKALGEPALWEMAESQLAEALDEFVGKDGWKVNPGDGAFYGPKIDIKVFDALDRIHQCATIQLDFQLPRRFNLLYRTEASASAGGDVAPGELLVHPVMVHRAMLGSVERMTAVLTEHFGGKWPFWLSPRQVLVVPVSMHVVDYAHEVQRAVHTAGFYCDIEDSNKTMDKKIREGQMAQYNFILVVGKTEAVAKAVNVRTRANEVRGLMSINEAISMFREMQHSFQ